MHYYFVIVQVNIPELVLNKLLKDITAHLHVCLLAWEKGTYVCIYYVHTYAHTYSYILMKLKTIHLLILITCMSIAYIYCIG